VYDKILRAWVWRAVMFVELERRTRKGLPLSFAVHEWKIIREK
jgi:hypothetical protein